MESTNSSAYGCQLRHPRHVRRVPAVDPRLQRLLQLGERNDLEVHGGAGLLLELCDGGLGDGHVGAVREVDVRRGSLPSNCLRSIVCGSAWLPASGVSLDCPGAQAARTDERRSATARPDG